MAMYSCYQLLWIFMIFGTAAAHEVHPGLVRSVLDIFNNMSNVASMPELMTTKECRRDCELYRQFLFNNEMWAAEMFDASGKFSSGVLKGNFIQNGNLKECINVNSHSIKGKFCYVNIYIRPKGNQKFVEEVWKKNLNVLKIEELVWGLCIPSTCTPTELKNALTKILSPLNQPEFDMNINVNTINDGNCVVKEERGTGNRIKTLFIGLFVFACIATLIDAVYFEKIDDISTNFGVALIKSFSVKFNWKSAFNVDESTEQIKWVNGLICILQFVLYIKHFNLRFFLINFVDKAECYEFLLNNIILLTLIRNMYFTIDVAVFLHGICHSYKLTKLLSQKKYNRIFQLCLKKYIKFLCFMMIIISLKYIGKNDFGFRTHVWSNDFSLWKVILCIENISGVLKMGFPPAYLLYINTQLFIIGSLVLVLYGRRKNAMRYFIGLIILVLIYRAITVYANNVSPVLMVPFSAMELFNMVDLMHNSALMTSAFYLSGVAIGYYISINKTKSFDTNPIFEKIGWIVALLFGFYSLFCINFKSPSYVYRGFDAVLVNSSQTICLIIFLVWTTWYCHTFENSILSRFLSHKNFIVLNRISGIFAIISLVVLLNYVLLDRYGAEHFQLTEFGLNYFIISLLLCYVVVFVIQLPARNMIKYFKLKYST